MKKRIAIGAAVILLLLLGGLIFLGNYFVNYALVPGNGGANRDAVVETKEAAELTSIEKNRDLENTAVEKWLKDATYQKVSITSSDKLKLAGTKYVPDKPGHKWAILIHGYTGKKEDMKTFAMHYVKEGYQVLTPDLRSHGESQGTYIGMGWPDRKDILLWIDFILSYDPDAEIVIHGISMGAATAMMVSGEDLPIQVKGFIEDCGYTSVWDIFKSELKVRFGLPSFPVLDAANLVAMVRAGYNLKTASALEQVKKCTKPMLFIHGAQDSFVPTSMVYPLYEAAACEKDLYIVPGAGHGEAKNADPEAYFQRVFTFIESAM